MILALKVVVGVALLLLGRRLFWLFVGGVGFITGLVAASYLVPDQQGWMGLGIAIGVGIVGAALALVLQHSLVWITGFLAGGIAAVSLVQLFNIEAWMYSLIAFLVGGLVGAILTSTMFDWGLVIISSVLGSVLIVNSVSLKASFVPVALALLFAVGVILQNIKLKRLKKKES